MLVEKRGADMRKRIFEIIEVAKEDDLLSRYYDWFMIMAMYPGKMSNL